MCIPSCYSYYQYKIQYFHNSTLSMDKVGCLLGHMELLVARTEGSVLLVGISGVAKKVREA